MSAGLERSDELGVKSSRLGADGLIGLTVRSEESRDGSADLIVGRGRERRVATTHISEISLGEFRRERWAEIGLGDTKLLRERTKGRNAPSLRESEDRGEALLEAGLVAEFVEEAVSEFMPSR